jgi:hypothetical protein
MTRSNWEVEDGAVPSLVNSSSSTFSLFWTVEHRVGRPADGPVRLGWLKSSRRRVKTLVWVWPVTPFGLHCEQG